MRLPRAVIKIWGVVKINHTQNSFRFGNQGLMSGCGAAAIYKYMGVVLLIGHDYNIPQLIPFSP